MRVRQATADLLGAVRAVATRPGRVRDVRWLLWVALLRLSLPSLKRRLPLERLVRLVPATAGSRVPAQSVAPRVALLEQWLAAGSPLLPGNCLERSLIVHSTFATGVADTALVVGFRRTDAGVVEGHTWVTVDGRVALEPPGSPGDFTATCAFDASGDPVDVPGGRHATSLEP